MSNYGAAFNNVKTTVELHVDNNLKDAGNAHSDIDTKLDAAVKSLQEASNSASSKASSDASAQSTATAAASAVQAVQEAQAALKRSREQTADSDLAQKKAKIGELTKKQEELEEELRKYKDARNTASLDPRFEGTFHTKCHGGDYHFVIGKGGKVTWKLQMPSDPSRNQVHELSVLRLTPTAIQVPAAPERTIPSVLMFDTATGDCVEKMGDWQFPYKRVGEHIPL